MKLPWTVDTIAPEAACTSVQFHLQVAPDEFAALERLAGLLAERWSFFTEGQHGRPHRADFDDAQRLMFHSARVSGDVGIGHAQRGLGQEDGGMGGTEDL